jgi:hypothetical protein
MIDACGVASAAPQFSVFTEEPGHRAGFFPFWENHHDQPTIDAQARR